MMKSSGLRAIARTALVLIFAWASAHAAVPAEELSVFGTGHDELPGQGYVNSKGEVVIPATYSRAYPFGPNGLARVERDDDVGFIDARGAWAIAPGPFSSLGDFGRNGLAVAFIRVGTQSHLGGFAKEHRHLAGFIDARGAWVIRPRFRTVAAFASNGLALAVDDKTGKAGFIDIHGQWRIPPRFRRALSFSDNGLALAESPGVAAEPYVHPGLHGYIDSEGRWAIAPRFRYAQSFSAHGLAHVVDTATGKVGYIDRTGAWALPPTFEDGSRDFGPHGRAIVRLEDRSDAIVDTRGNLIRLPGPVQQGFGEQGLAVAWNAQGTKMGLIDGEGRWVLPAQFDAIGDSRGEVDFPRSGWLAVAHQGRARLVDRSGRFASAFDAYVAKYRTQKAAAREAEARQPRRGFDFSTRGTLHMFGRALLGPLVVVAVIIGALVLVLAGRYRQRSHRTRRS